MNIRHLSLAIVFSAALTACGGGDSGPSVTRVVSFGDSVSDLGTYAVTSSLSGTGAPPFFAGRFTTNTHTGYTAASNTNTAANWVEWVAAKVGVPITQAMLGFGAVRVPCPAAGSIPSFVDTCTAYGQGGSRVTDPNGINHAAGALTDPVVTQVAAHLAKFTSFSSSDIVLVFAGGNDVLIQFGAAAQGLPAATAVANMQTAGSELATLIKNQIVAKGATRVAVLNFIDLSLTPGFLALPAPNKAFLTQLTTEFNASLSAGLAGASVSTIDARSLFADVAANPSKYGFTNVTEGACDPAKITAVTGGRITDGSSLFCNAAAGQPFNTLKTGASASTWAFADGVHPTTAGQKVLGDYVIAKIKEFGWIPANQ